jgi:hypothetical protein
MGWGGVEHADRRRDVGHGEHRRGGADDDGQREADTGNPLGRHRPAARP